MYFYILNKTQDGLTMDADLYHDSYYMSRPFEVALATSDYTVKVCGTNGTLRTDLTRLRRKKAFF
jgi:IS1 family transposase